MQMPGRTNSSASYRYGFNGKENDNDVKGTSNQQDYGMRIYDPRLGRFLSVDPLTGSYPFNSSYAFSEGDPISNIDLDGLERQKAINGQIISGPVDIKPINASIWKNASAQQQQAMMKQITMSVMAKSLFSASAASTSSTAYKRSNTDHPAPGPNRDQIEREIANSSTNGRIEKLVAQQSQNPVTVSAPSPRSGYSDFEFGMITNPAIQAASTGLAAAPILVEGSALFKGTLAARTTSALADATSQGLDIMTGGKAASDYNVTSTIANFAMPNAPFFSAAFGSAGEYSVGSGFSNSAQFLNLGGNKSLIQFGMETTIGGAFNKFASTGNDLMLTKGLNSSKIGRAFAGYSSNLLGNQFSNINTIIFQTLLQKSQNPPASNSSKTVSPNN